MTSWRRRCPEGHASLRTRSRRPYTYCEVCDEVYPDDELRDAVGDHDPDPREVWTP